MKRKPANLKKKLDAIVQQYDREFLHSDPVMIPHQFTDPADQEIVAFIAAVYAYGSVKQILGSVRRVLDALGGIDPSPSRAVRAFSARRDRARFAAVRHRFNRGDDAACLVQFLQKMIEQNGSIEGFFAAAAPREAPLRDRIAAFCERALALDFSNIYENRDGVLPENAGVRFFFTNPRDGSACKRLCMFLRWVVRPADGIDLGLWSTLTSAELVMPLDTHTTRICYCNGLSPSPFATWRNAEHVTNELKKFNFNDPVCYDFAISRLGILRVGRDRFTVRMPSRSI